MKSGPRNTDLTPSMRNRSLARGEHWADDRVGKSMVSDSRT